MRPCMSARSVLRPTARLLAVPLLAAAIMTATATSASAVVDPALVISCVGGSVGDITQLIDPAAPGVPAEIPAVHCLAP